MEVVETFFFLSGCASLAFYMVTRRRRSSTNCKKKKKRSLRENKANNVILFVSGLPTNARPLKSKLHRIFKPYANNKRFKIKLGVNSMNHGLGFAYVFLPMETSSSHDGVSLADQAIKDLHQKELKEDEYFIIDKASNQGTVLQVSKSIGKVDILFADLTPDQRSLIQLDSVSLFSVADMLSSKTINSVLSAVCACADVLPKDVTITDGCACVGGNVLAFSDIFKTVNAVEIDPTRCNMLKHNLEAVCKRTNVAFYNEDYSKSYTSYVQDIVYLDPPWGGTLYTSVDKDEKLFLGGKSLIDYFCSLERFCSICTARVPSHYDVTNFANEIIQHYKKATSVAHVERKGKTYMEMPLIFQFHIGTKAILLVVVYPPRIDTRKGGKKMQLGVTKLDTLVKRLFLLDKKGKKLKQKFYDWDVERWIRLGAWHGV